jgi:hypothetical protein
MFRIMDNLEVAKDFIQTAVDNTVGAVQSAHTVIADASFRVIQQGAGDSEKVAALKEKHDAAASQVYGAIREVNRTLGQLASDFFEAADDGANAARTMSERRTETDQTA